VQAAGLGLLGRAAWRRERVLHFDSVKRTRQARPAQRRSLIDKLATRDVYAFVFMLAALGGVLASALALFLLASLVWLAVVIRSLR
jgi:hypothetical protein